VVKTNKSEARKGPPPRHPGYRHARNSSGGCGVRAKSDGAANRKQDGAASGVCFGAFSSAQD